MKVSESPECVILKLPHLSLYVENMNSVEKALQEGGESQTQLAFSSEGESFAFGSASAQGSRWAGGVSGGRRGRGLNVHNPFERQHYLEPHSLACRLARMHRAGMGRGLNRCGGLPNHAGLCWHEA